MNLSTRDFGERVNQAVNVKNVALLLPAIAMQAQ